MYNFTGQSRKPRTVNLSGRQSGAKPPSLAAARVERQAREAQRRRHKAATDIQRTWRGRRAAQLQRQAWRRAWDAMLADDDLRGHSQSLTEALTLFLGFFERGIGVGSGKSAAGRKWDPADLERLGLMVAYIKDWAGCGEALDARLRHLLRNFSGVLVQAVSMAGEDLLEDILAVLALLSRKMPEIVDDRYYAALSRASLSGVSWTDKALEAVVSPMNIPNGDELLIEKVYISFATKYLTTPGLNSLLWHKDFEVIQNHVHLKRLTKTLLSNPKSLEEVDVEGRLWMLSYIIHFSRHPASKATPTDKGNWDEKSYFMLFTLLLSSVAVDVSQRIDIEDSTMDDDESSDEDDGRSSTKRRGKRDPLPGFVKSQLQSLLQQSTISSLLSKSRVSDGDARTVASFALTLLLVFPTRKNEVRLLLCLEKTADGVPAVHYIWKAVKETSLFSEITKDAKITVERLRPAKKTDPETLKSIDKEWTLILLFLEIYEFLLFVTDDDEFFSGGTGVAKERQLPLGDVKDLTVFLKNLAFAMYWWNGEIMGEDKAKDAGGEVYFQPETHGRSWEIKHLRNIATNVLRMIYTRDSRRSFLPQGHWLLNNRFFTLDGGFIATVVLEENNRHEQLDNESDNEEDASERTFDREALAALSPFERRYLHSERLRKAQQKKQKMAYLAAIAPRLEIVQNLPFFIPFATRVQIFRDFVLADMKRRRYGDTDPDRWRSHVLSTADGHERLGRHHAMIRRGNEFDDAYRAFWNIGEGLKEPIQITFIDKWGQEEAGIDGGGVTKEFLTSVCMEAFTPSEPRLEDWMDKPVPGHDIKLFDTNSQHLLYPNPMSIEQERYHAEVLHDMDNASVQNEIRSLRNHYEFLGRILGKCLYEGILVDISFAPFFLLKWSQPTTGPGVVGFNDLKDMDEQMYNGLVRLRNYDGDVEDFGLTFSVDSKIPDVPKTISTPLKPNGENIPVTNSNRLEYIHLMSRYRLSVQPMQQTAAFLKGLGTLIKPSWLSMFNQSELQTLVGGDMKHPIDVDDLRNNTEYSGVYSIGDDGEEHPTIKLFWKVVQELDDEHRRNLLKFVTSVARAPLLGFGVLRPRFTIRDAGDDETRLCSASTCVNLLKMPRYSSYKTLREKLVYSINAGAGFDLS